MLKNSGDMTSVVDLTREKGTGPTRRQRPVYVDLLPPCNNACPAGENIQAWLALAQAGRFREAWETLVRDNPLPAVHGRVCYHPCETSCNRKELDSAVSIHAVERFLGDLAAEQGWTVPIDAPPTGKRVLVVGAGPSGLSAAYHLARLGHAGRDPRGRAAPRRHAAFRHSRLPPAARRPDEGGRAHRGHGRQDRAQPQGRGRRSPRSRPESFDAVFVAIGAHVSKHVDIPARDAVSVLDAVSLLRGVSTGEAPRSAAASSSMAAATRRWTPRAPRGASAPRRR